MKEDLHKKQGNMEEENKQSHRRSQMTRQGTDKEEGEHQLRVRGLCGCCLFLVVGGNLVTSVHG